MELPNQAMRCTRNRLSVDFPKQFQLIFVPGQNDYFALRHKTDTFELHKLNRHLKYLIFDSKRPNRIKKYCIIRYQKK